MLGNPVFGALLRWVHFVAAIIWIGHNYVNVIHHPRYQPLTLDDLAQRSERFMVLLYREHAMFRYASIVVWLTGVGMLWQRHWLRDAFALRGYQAVIGMGSWIGTIMVLNLWLIMWPHQKKVLGFVPASPEERIRSARITFLSARTNTVLSIPLLFFMGAAEHGLALFR